MHVNGMWDGRPFFLDFTGKYKPGDPPPSGYTAWHAWAKVQHEAGLRQVRCCKCNKLQYPQELSEKSVVTKAFRSDGTRVRVVSPLCKACDQAALAKE